MLVSTFLDRIHAYAQLLPRIKIINGGPDDGERERDGRSASGSNEKKKEKRQARSLLSLSATVASARGERKKEH